MTATPMVLGARADAPAWERDGRDWPNREASRFVRAGRLRWHVQVMGDGPVVLMVHGTGAATHSWRSLAPLLARHFTVVAPDLPGHGFTTALPDHRMSPDGMAIGLRDLLRTLDLTPALAVGHSAGAAIVVRMSLDGHIAPSAIVSLNGALLPFGGLAGRVFAPLARVLVGCPVVPRIFSWRAGDPAAVERLVRNTGSTIDAAGLALYGRLVRTPGHVAAALAMMANWDLDALERDLPRLVPHLVLVAADADLAIPPGQAWRVRRLVPDGEVVPLSGLGHLAHEERPGAAEAIIVEAARRQQLLPGEPPR